MRQTYYSNGKLLITGEYAVLDGAVALALPTKQGQSMLVEGNSGRKITWNSFDPDGSPWFNADIAFADIIQCQRTGTDAVRDTLIGILHKAYALNPDYLDNSEGYAISTHLAFPKDWGLGTSSTLINNIAQWLEIDAFLLLKGSFGGSGYDIACAQHNTPILYRLDNDNPVIQSVNFNPVFAERLYFIYLNKKQNSRNAIAAYRDNREDLSTALPDISRITLAILASKDIAEFSGLLERHELIMSKLLGLPTVKAALFPDFEGAVKSLGAWGGDFILAVSEHDPLPYFKDKGYATVIPFGDMVLK